MSTPTPLLDRFDASRPVVGMVHLPPLPGAPGFDGDRDAIRQRALEDARRLEAGGIDGLILENFGDAPFYPENVPKHVVAELTAVAAELTNSVDVPVGINVLRNDAEAALSIAAAVDADFVRVNVHVKHATPVGEADIERAALETAERGRADGVVVSGTGTGVETALEDVERVSETLQDTEPNTRTPVFVGSGITSETVGNCLEAGADGVIVGTALKQDGETTNPVSRERVEKLVAAARDSSSLS